METEKLISKPLDSADGISSQDLQDDIARIVAKRKKTSTSPKLHRPSGSKMAVRPADERTRNKSVEVFPEVAKADPIAFAQNMKNFNHINSIYIGKLKTIRLKVSQDCIVDPSGSGVVAIEDHEQIHDILSVLYAQLDEDQEHTLMLVLNPMIDIVGFKVISSGAQNFCILDTKIVFRNALFLGAANIIMTHNHTSGSLIPSETDIEFTRKIVKAGFIMNIPVVDHFIFTHKGLLSMRMEEYCLFDEPA